MTDLAAFPITRRWPAQHPDRIQLYSLPTPNGVKASIMLEECGLPYEPHLVDFANDDQKSAAFESLNPNGKIPAMIDPDGPGGASLALFESGAILLYLAEKTGRFLGNGPVDRWHAIQWVMFQMGGVGPMFGQLGFFNKFAGKDWEDKRPRDRYVAEAKRLLGVMDGVLAGREWFLGADYSIADISMLGWVRNLIGFYEARDLVGFNGYADVAAWLERGLARPAVQRGLEYRREDELVAPFDVGRASNGSDTVIRRPRPSCDPHSNIEPVFLATHRHAPSPRPLKSLSSTHHIALPIGDGDVSSLPCRSNINYCIAFSIDDRVDRKISQCDSVVAVLKTAPVRVSVGNIQAKHRAEY